MRLRPVVLCTLTVGLVAGGAALAAPKQVCNLIVDAEGDGKMAETAPSNALDILSADIATGKKEFVGVVRVKSTQTSSDPIAMIPPGVKWSVAFIADGVNHSFSVTRQTTPTGATDRVTSSVAGKEVPGVVATIDGTSITFRVPRSSLPALKKPKQTLTSLAAMSYVGGGKADTAVGTGQPKYVDLTPSCVKAA